MRRSGLALKNGVLVGLLVGALVLCGPTATGAPPERPVPPLTYNAVSDTKMCPKPELVKVGPAGFLFRDPTFGCPIVRVSDEKTASGSSILTPAGAEQNPWNADTTLFCLLTNNMQNIPFRFDPKTMKATRIEGLPFLPGIGGVAPFSYRDPNVCYGKLGRRGVIVKFDFVTRKTTDVFDVGKLTGLPVGHMGAFTISANDVVALTFGGKMQNMDPYLLVYDLKTKNHRLWNTKEGTLDGKPLPTEMRFTQHSSHIDQSGRYVWTAGPGVRGPVIWDVEKGTVYPMTVKKAGHIVTGYGEMVNDIHQWIYRKLDPEGINTYKELMKHPAGQGYFGYDSHISWNNARPDMKMPVVLSTYHRKERGDPKCVWGDEIIAVSTDGSMKVWRFAHHRSVIHHGRGGPVEKRYNFWDSPRGNVSQCGRFFMLTSNWGETLGKDGRGRFRQDVFIVKLDREDAGATGTDRHGR